MSNYGVCYDGENGGLLKVTWKGDIEKRYIMVFIQRQLKEIIDICFVYAKFAFTLFES
jgi:hypothetical protein